MYTLSRSQRGDDRLVLEPRGWLVTFLPLLSSSVFPSLTGGRPPPRPGSLPDNTPGDTASVVSAKSEAQRPLIDRSVAGGLGLEVPASAAVRRAVGRHRRRRPWPEDQAPDERDGGTEDEWEENAQFGTSMPLIHVLRDVDDA